MANSRWRKSSYSGGESSNCVELDRTERSTAIRDSKNPVGPTLTIATRPGPAY